MTPPDETHSHDTVVAAAPDGPGVVLLVWDAPNVDMGLGSILGGDALDVPTYHHQAVRTHPGYDAAAWHEDGTLEAMEDTAYPFRLAVQWHPEAGTDTRLFDALVAACRPERGGGATLER